MCVMWWAGPLCSHLLDFTTSTQGPLQALRCFYLSCAHHDFTLDKNLSALLSRYCHSQSVPTHFNFHRRGTSLGYDCNHGFLRGNEALRCPAIFPGSLWGACFDISEAKLFVSDALLSSWSLSRCPFLTVPFHWTDFTCASGHGCS